MTTTSTQNPFELEKARLLERLALIVPPNAAPMSPGPAWYEAVRDFAREIAEVIDDAVEAIGFEVANNAPYRVDANDFRAVMSGAIADAAFSCDNIAERLRDDREAA